MGTSPDSFSLDISRAELAEALLVTNVELAAQVAGIEFERSVRRLTHAKRDDKLWDLVCHELPGLVREFHQSEPRVTDTIIDCKEAVRTRNDAVHSESAPDQGRINRLIETMKVVGEIERMRHQRHKTSVNTLSEQQPDASRPATVPGFWSELTVDQLAAKQGIVVPQRLNAVIGAASDLWDDDEDFDVFVQGIHDRRLDGAQGSKGER